jgi:hypothetical protein
LDLSDGSIKIFAKSSFPPPKIIDPKKHFSLDQCCLLSRVMFVENYFKMIGKQIYIKMIEDNTNKVCRVNCLVLNYIVSDCIVFIQYNVS